MPANASVFKVRITPPLHTGYAPLIIPAKAVDADHAIDRVKRHMEARAVNHITKAAAAGYIDMASLTYTIEAE